MTLRRWTILGLVSLFGPVLVSMRAGELRLNQIQIVGTHNSYHLRPPEAILHATPQAAQLDYGEAPLPVQLQAGVRSFALDVYRTDQAFRILHIPGIDEGTTCKTLGAGLTQLAEWSRQHPGHVPLILFIEVKSLDRPQDDLLPMDRAGIDRLDAVVRSQLGDDRLLRPGTVQGDAPSLERGILTRGWPTLHTVRGKILVVMNAPADLSDYYTGRKWPDPGRAMFVKVKPGDPNAAIVVVNDPRSPKIPLLLRRGYIVRTRADSGVKEAANGDTSRRDAALASGAQIVTTDFPSATPHPRTGYFVALPGGVPARPDPVTAAGVSRGNLELQQPASGNAGS